jgi:hypothetical protein
MTPAHTRLPGLKKRVPAGLLGTTGALLGVGAIASLSAHPDPPVWWRVEVVVLSAVTAAIVATAHWLANSDYEARDVWTVLGWSVLGVAGAGLLTGLLSAHQRIEGMAVAEPTFLFETLALIGAALGVAVGVDWESLADRRLLAGVDDQTGPVTIAADADSDTAPTVLALLDTEQTSVLRRRMRVVRHLLETDTRELPFGALVAMLARPDAPEYPSDEERVQHRLAETDLPPLEASGFVDIDEELGTVRYVGPETVADPFDDDRPETDRISRRPRA